ncbi:MAG: DUF3006 domain-containing protein [Oscillospiraceae bacterium]|nr:DUF3006 domain-containing protein [Oscillospiraceae bacterium]
MAGLVQPTYAVDRIEGDHAICECLETGAQITIDKKTLPPKVKEGDILRQSGEDFVLDEALQKQRHKQLTDRLNRLFDRHK